MCYSFPVEAGILTSVSGGRRAACGFTRPIADSIESHESDYSSQYPCRRATSNSGEGSPEKHQYECGSHGAVQGIGIRKTIQHHELDELAGSWSFREAKSFDRTIEIGRQINKDLWR